MLRAVMNVISDDTLLPACNWNEKRMLPPRPRKWLREMRDAAEASGKPKAEKFFYVTSTCWAQTTANSQPEHDRHTSQPQRPEFEGRDLRKLQKANDGEILESAVRPAWQGCSRP